MNRRKRSAAHTEEGAAEEQEGGDFSFNLRELFSVTTLQGDKGQGWCRNCEH